MASDPNDASQTANNAQGEEEFEDDWVSEEGDDASDSGTESKPDEPLPSYDKLIRWWRKTNSSAKDLRKISKSLVKIKKTRTLDWKREMKEVIANVDGVLQLRDELNEELEKEVGNVSDSGDEEDITVCIPTLHYVQWIHMTAWRHDGTTYAAIDIPLDKGPDHFREAYYTPHKGPPPPLRGPSGPRQGTRLPLSLPTGYFPIKNVRPPRHNSAASPANADAKFVFEENPILEGVPHRIRINSFRLQTVIMEERRAIGDTHMMTTDAPDHSARLVILQPFKILYYFEDKLRSRLRQYEEVRSKQLPHYSEEDFQALYDKRPVSDGPWRQPIPKADSMGPNLLTAFINDLRCLVKFLDLYLIPERDRVLNMGHSPSVRIQPADLWHLFPVGSLVYSNDEQIPQKILRVAHTFFGRVGKQSNGPFYHIQNGVGFKKPTRPSTFFADCYYVEYDGSHYVPVHHRFQVQQELGASLMYSFKTMPLVPLKVALRRGVLTNREKEDMISRGRRFIEYATGSRHLYYTGRSYSVTPTGEKLPHVRQPEDATRSRTIQYSVRVDSPVMVDYARAFQEVPWWRPDGSGLNRTAMGKNVVIWSQAPTSNVESEKQIVVDQDYNWDVRVFSGFIEHESKKWRAWEDGGAPFEEEDLLLLPGRIFAFVFRNRKWACLQLDHSEDGTGSLTEIVSRPEPWTDLELPEGHKEVVQSLINWHFKADKKVNPHFDLVREKGKGVIILLHGVPGVGKTSTAECAAESNGRPLFPITCGDLGLTPQDVELKLEEIFRLAQAWGCILLLDEADVFLAQRTASDIHRNSLVSVFLRILEHYEGILFLTTNRVGVFDEAFKSRIHVSLYYPPLDHNQTYQIWQTHITKAMEAGIQLNRDELITFAAKIFASQKDPKSGPVWNGRQIRNAFQSALALAGFHSGGGQSVRLETQHFQKVFNVSDKFSNYIWRVRQGHSDADWNRMNMVRRDDFDYIPPIGLDSMNNFVPPGPYGMYPGGQARFGAGGSGAFPQSAFGQSILSAVLGIPQPRETMPSVSPTPSTFGSVANPFQQYAQSVYHQQSAAGPVQPHGAANVQAQQQQQP